jgi:hypothetical protein
VRDLGKLQAYALKYGDDRLTDIIGIWFYAAELERRMDEQIKAGLWTGSFPGVPGFSEQAIREVKLRADEALHVAWECWKTFKPSRGRRSKEQKRNELLVKCLEEAGGADGLARDLFEAEVMRTDKVATKKGATRAFNAAYDRFKAKIAQP